MLVSSLAASALLLSSSNLTDAAELANVSAPPPLSINVSYSGSVIIFRVANITLSGQIADDTYGATARFTTAGLAALFSDADIEAGITGYADGALRPWRYAHFNHSSGSGRTVGINFPEGVATADVVPPFGSMGEPPASEAERDGAVDPISALLRLGLRQSSDVGELCSGRIPVFDGKARYDLRLQVAGANDIRTRAWRGEATRCHAFYEPIAGYDPEDLPTESDIAEPVVLWLAPFADGTIHLPVRIRTNSGFGAITIEARSIAVEPVAD
ncbi:DUF3108 domain-containing protein [Hyphobacterium sp.]|jgi:hypothetical protein|uniref:DUF3108 domain-containing protein n=1 Tax=Hyphobacterium sp. TaxID=2004662 RepID=UPI003BA9B3C3